MIKRIIEIKGRADEVETDLVCDARVDIRNIRSFGQPRQNESKESWIAGRREYRELDGRRYATTDSHWQLSCPNSDWTRQAISSGTSSVTALSGSTEEEQFTKVAVAPTISAEAALG